MAVTTNFINKIAIHPTANTALPSLATLGANIATWSGYTLIGSKQAGDAADLDEGSVKVDFFEEYGEVHPPRSLTREDIVLFKNGVKELSFMCYDGSEALLTLGSGIVVASHIGEATATLTKRTVAIEVNGLCVDYFPNSVVHVKAASAGYTKDVAKIEFKIIPCATSSQKGGWERQWYQAA